MNTTIMLAKRNTKIFLRDKVSVFFSFLSIIIIFLLYAMFLGDMQVKQFKIESVNITDIKYFINSWIIAGIIAVTIITSSLAAFAIVVKDKQNNTINDFMSSPIKRSEIMLGYLIAAVISSFILTSFSFLLGEIFIVLNGGNLLSLIDTIKVFGIIIISIISFSPMIFLLVSFLKSETAFGILSTIIGTFIGFLTAVYIPFGVLGNEIKNLIFIFSPSYTAVALRKIFLKEPFEIVFKNAPTNVIGEMKEFYGESYNIFGKNISFLEIIGIIAITGIIFYALSFIKVIKKYGK